MQVFVSAAFHAYASDQVRADLIQAFKWWKTSPDREFKSPFFAKDSATAKPSVNGKKHLLRHCHLIPLHDAEALAKWVKNLRWHSRKTSDRVLVYVQRDDDYFLIDVVDDPGAHQIMRMFDKNGKSFMLSCAQSAEAFLNRELELEPA